jgi:hypothetical protein
VGILVASNRLMAFVNDSTKLLAVGSLVFGAWGVIHPRSLTRLMGDDPQLGRQLGLRDIVVGVALLRDGGPIPLGIRVASDTHDAIRLRERSPLVALGAAAIAVWGAATLVASVRDRRRVSLSGTL